MCVSCNTSGNAPHQRANEEMILRSSNSTSFKYNQAPTVMGAGFMDEIPVSSIAYIKSSTDFVSSTARSLIAISSIVLLLISLIGIGSGPAANVKDLSDTVLDLTQQLHTLQLENINRIDEVDTLEKLVTDKDIELGWGVQHLHNQEESQNIMYQSLVRQLDHDVEVMERANEKASKIVETSRLAEREIEKGRAMNADLKQALDSALEELANARKLTNGGSRGNDDLDGNDGRMLRGVTPYLPGDSIDIIEYRGGEMVVLWPGFVSHVNKDGTFNLVNLNNSTGMKDMRIDQFQRYQPYEEGTPAFLREGRDIFVPITIKKFVPGASSLKSLTIHDGYGSYEYTRDKSEQELAEEVRATMIFRYAVYS